MISEAGFQVISQFLRLLIGPGLPTRSVDVLGRHLSVHNIVPNACELRFGDDDDDDDDDVVVVVGDDDDDDVDVVVVVGGDDDDIDDDVVVVVVGGGGGDEIEKDNDLLTVGDMVGSGSGTTF